MKRFLMFGFDDYYPAGGWNDFRGEADDTDELVQAAEDLESVQPVRENYHIVDTQDGNKVTTYEMKTIEEGTRRKLVEVQARW